MRRILPFLLFALLTACQQQTAEEKGAQDSRDVALVEAAQKLHPPVQPITPESMNPAVRKIFKLTAQGCEFHTAEQPGADPVLVTGRAKAVLRVNDNPFILAADSGSGELAPGLYRKYTGRTHWIEISRTPDALTLRDRWDRIVYHASGGWNCHD